MTLLSDNATVENLLTLNALVKVPSSTASTLNGSLTLVVGSLSAQVVTGTATGFSVVLPNATTLVAGQRYEIYNTSTQSVTIKTNGGATLSTLGAGAVALVALRVATPAAGVWDYYLGATNSPSAAGSAGDVQFRGATAGTFAVNASGWFRWDNTAGSLQIGPTGGPVFSNNALGIAASVDAFAQVNAQNLSNGASASTDYIATADNGTDTTNYVDLGINGSGYSDPAFDINGPGDAYLYASDGNIAVGSAAKDFILFAGGTLHANEVARGAAAGYFQQNVGRVHVPTLTASTLNGTLTLTSRSPSIQVITGTQTGYSVVLPSATTLIAGHKYEIYNQTTQTITVKDGSGATLFTLPSLATAYVLLQVNTPAAGVWVYFQVQTANVAQGIANFSIVSSTTFTTSSATDVIITGFTVTPVSGTYAIWYNASSTQATNGANQDCTIYKGGSAIVDSDRNQRGGAANITEIMSTMTVAQFNGSQACDVRVRTNTGSITIGARTLVLIRLGV